MYRLIPGAVALSLLLLAPASAGPGKPCDLSNVVKGSYCEKDDRALLEKDLVSEVTYFACPECTAIHKEAGKCTWCDKELEKKVSGKGVCPDCIEKPVAAEVCVRIYFECPDCGSTSRSADKCADCDVERKEKTSRALVQYVCGACGATSLVPGKCTDSECEGCGKDLVRTCSESGRFPHSKD